MRIGITCYPTYGGSGVVATELGIELALSATRSTSSPIRSPSVSTAATTASSITRSRSPTIRSSSFRPTIWRWPRAWLRWPSTTTLDLLHVHYAIPHSVSALLARQMLAARGRRLPFVTTLHGTDITLVGLDRSYLPITRYAIQESDGVTSISQLPERKNAGQTSASRAPLRSSQTSSTAMSTRPIADEAERAEAPPALRPARRSHPDAPLQLPPRQARHRRGQDLRPRRQAKCPRSWSSSATVPTAPPPSGSRTISAFTSRVHFLGKQERVSELARPSPICCSCPASWRSFGLAALEAMACKVPSIATRVGGVPELIDDGVTGLLYQRRRCRRHGRGAIELLHDPRRGSTPCAKPPATHAQKRFCSTLVVPQYVQFYESLLART